MNRIDWIDAAKGILIILVVAGHCHINPICDTVISSFHMAGFFILSGINLRTERTVLSFVNRRFKCIYIPYLILSFILLSYFFTKSLVGLQENFSWIDGIISILVPISGSTKTSVYALWFLPCLFLSEIILYFCIKLTEKSIFNKSSLYVVFGIIWLTLFRSSPTISIFRILPYSILFILIGFILKNIFTSGQLFHARYFLIVLSLFLSSLYLNASLENRTYDLSSLTIGNPILFITCGITGSCIIYSISRFVCNPIFLRIGKNSLLFYGLHYEVMGVCSAIFPQLGGGIKTFLVMLILYVTISGFCHLKLYLKP